MFFPSRIDPTHAGVISDSVYRQHVSRRAGVDRVGIGITTEIVETGDHRILKPLVDYVLPPEITHPVLHPFEIRDGYPSGVSQNVWDYEDALTMKYFIGGGRGGAISAFRKDFTLDSVRILGGNLILGGSRNQDVAFQL